MSEWNSLWSTQTRVELRMVMQSLSLMKLMRRFWMMTFVPLKTSMPLPVMWAVVPTPIRDLLEPTLRREGSTISPTMWTILGASPATAVLSAAGVLTVTVAPPFPPVVRPMGFSLANPSTPHDGFLSQSGRALVKDEKEKRATRAPVRRILFVRRRNGQISVSTDCLTLMAPVNKEICHSLYTHDTDSPDVEIRRGRIPTAERRTLPSTSTASFHKRNITRRRTAPLGFPQRQEIPLTRCAEWWEFIRPGKVATKPIPRHWHLSIPQITPDRAILLHPHSRYSVLPTAYLNQTTTTTIIKAPSSPTSPSQPHPTLPTPPPA